MRRVLKTRRLLDFTMLLVAMIGISALPTFGQIDRGAINGKVVDSSGAVVPGAVVTITNKATGVVVSTPVDSAGEYQVQTLNPGNYAVRASADGFETSLRDDIEVHVQDHIAINFELKVGSVKQEITVSTGEPILQTESADVGGIVNSQQIVDLPLNGRRYADLALLEPGVDKFYGAANPAPDRFSVSGNLETQNNFLLNGIDNNSFSENLQELSVQVVQPPPDALEEFKVQTRTYSAEFGNSAGAVVNVSLKSGSNGYHGVLFEFLRNKVLDANQWINNVTDTPRGGFSQNQFGGTLGGPIVKDKLFFFGDLERFTSRQSTTIVSTVPTPLMTSGNFTELPNPIGTAITVPGQAGCYVGNIIQPGCFDPVAQKLMGLIAGSAVPNIPQQVALEGQPGSWNGNPNYAFATGVPQDVWSLDGRVDFNLSPKDTIFGSYSYRHVNRQDPLWTSNPLIGNGNFATQYKWRQQLIALGWTHTISSNLINDMRFGFNRDNAHSDPNGLTVGTSQAESAIGLTGIPPGPNDAGLPPFFFFVGSLRTLGTGAWRPQFQISQAYNFIDNLNWLKGKHSFKFGYQYLRRTDNFFDIEAPQGLLAETGAVTGSFNIGLPDLLLGDVNLVIFTTPHVVHYFQPGHSFYAMDTWKLTSKLTLTYGLRYELFAPLIDRQNQTSNFTPANGGGIITAASNAGGWFDRALIHPDLNNFAPRLGFAYQLMPRLVVRGGYGVFYQHENRIGSESLIQLNPPQFVDTQLVGGASNPVFQLQNGFPSAAIAAAGVNLTQIQLRAQDPNQRTPYVEQTSFGVEYEVNKNTSFSTTYVGNWGRKEERVRDNNQPVITGFDTGCPILQYPFANLTNMSTVDTFTPTGCSNPSQHAFLETATDDGSTAYNGVEFQLKQRSSHGLYYSLGYTLSHGLANFRDNLTAGQLPQDSYNYGAEMGNSVFDIRSRFVGNFLWDLPFGRGKRFMNGDNFAARWLGDWQFNGIVTLQTGTPFNITADTNNVVDGNNPVYADCVPGADPHAGATTNHKLFTTTGRFLNPAAFSVPATGTFGTCAPYQFYGPGIQMWDLSLFKDFHITERFKLQFRTEFFNAFNHPNFGNPNGDIGAANAPNAGFGKVSNTLNPILGSDSGGPGDPREIQFGLKLYF
jgi:hypothetical protein